jgi:hypothetical protein
MIRPAILNQAWYTTTPRHSFRPTLAARPRAVGYTRSLLFDDSEPVVPQGTADSSSSSEFGLSPIPPAPALAAAPGAGPGGRRTPRGRPRRQDGQQPPKWAASAKMGRVRQFAQAGTGPGRRA